MPRERELGRWCKMSPQILFDPKSRAARSFSLFLGLTVQKLLAVTPQNVSSKRKARTTYIHYVPRSPYRPPAREWDFHTQINAGWPLCQGVE